MRLFASKVLSCLTLIVLLASGSIAIAETETTSNTKSSADSQNRATPKPVQPKIIDANELTVWVFQQERFDTEIFDLEPQINIRTYGQWGRDGLKASDYDLDILERYRKNKVTYIGAITASVIFPDQFDDPTQFSDFVSRNASNEPVTHTEIPVPGGAFRANLANPKYRDYLVNIAKIQIDQGVPGIFFDEANSGYGGGQAQNYNRNEGFDDYHLKDFNRYLLGKYPSYSKQDFINQFAMNYDNALDPTIAPDDLVHNFNYRTYLASKGFQHNPVNWDNPLFWEFGFVNANRNDYIWWNFVSTYSLIYWGDIVGRVRAYARDTYNRNVYITSNGLFPWVDFNSVGLYRWNPDAPEGGPIDGVHYVPTTMDGKLDGAVSLQAAYKSLLSRSRGLQAGVPCVLFIDWPTEMMNSYYAFSAKEREDFWRIYAAEAYANGLFYAFHLKTAIWGDPSFVDLGLKMFFKKYMHFYKKNGELYKRTQPLDIAISVSAQNVNASLLHQPSQSRYSLHLVNHNYANAQMVTQSSINVSFPLAQAPKKIVLHSPDQSSKQLSFNYAAGNVSLVVPKLAYYDAIEIGY